MILNNELRGRLHALQPAAAHSVANQFAAHTVSDQFAGHTGLTPNCRAKHSSEDKGAGDDLPEGLLVKGADLVVHSGVALLVNGHTALPLVPDVCAGQGGVGIVGQSVLIRSPSQPRRPC